MLSQPRYTIIVVTYDAVARVDLLSGKSVEVVHSSRANRSPQAELGDAVKTGLSLGPKKCGRIFILSDDLWSGRVSLANEIVSAIVDDQLEQTLALEAELESGISPFESRVGHVRDSSSDGQTTWWVTQAESAQLNAIVATVPKWARHLSGFASTALTMPSEDTDKEPLDTASSDSCGALAQAWLNSYLSGACQLPVIHMTSQPWIEKHRKNICILTTVGTLAICALYHSHRLRQVSGANAQLSRLVALEKQLQLELADSEAVAQQYQDVKHQQDAQARQLDEHRSRQIEYAATRKRPVQLLRALAATADTGHWIQRIDANGMRVVISGVAINSATITALAERLESELDSSKWLVQPAVMSMEESKHLVRFELTVIPLKAAAQRFAFGGNGATHVR